MAAFNQDEDCVYWLTGQINKIPDFSLLILHYRKRIHKISKLKAFRPFPLRITSLIFDANRKARNILERYEGPAFPALASSDAVLTSPASIFLRRKGARANARIKGWL